MTYNRKLVLVKKVSTIFPSPTKEQKAYRKLVKIWEGKSLQSKLRPMMGIRIWDLEAHCSLVLRNIDSIVVAIYEGAFDVSIKAEDYREDVKMYPSVTSRADFMTETDKLFKRKLPDEFIYSTIRNGSNHGTEDQGLTLKRAKACMKFLDSARFDDVLVTMGDLQSGRVWVEQTC